MASAEGRENVNHRKSLWAGWSCIKVVEQVECILISALSQRKIFRNRVSAGTAWEFWDILKANSKLEKQVKGFVKKILSSILLFDSESSGSCYAYVLIRMHCTARRTYICWCLNVCVYVSTYTCR